MGHAKQTLSNPSTHLGNVSQSIQSIIVVHAFITTSHASLDEQAFYTWPLHSYLCGTYTVSYKLMEK